MISPRPSRRSFLKVAGAAGLSAAAGSTAFGRARQADSDRPVVGSGAYQYECIHGWGEVPGHIDWFETHGVAVDRDGLIYVTHRAGAERPSSPDMAQDTVVVFDPDGKFVRSFGKEYHGGGHGIDIREEDGQEYLYLAFMFPVNLVVKTDLKGEVVWVKEKPEEPGVYADPEARFSPTNVAFAPDGGFYVGDGYGSNYIHQYDKDGGWVRTWGGTGEEPGKMRTPHGLWFDSRPGRTPELVVADRANARLQYFTPEGEFDSILDEVSFPAHFDIRGDLLLVPDLHARISLFDRENRVIDHLGYDPDWTAEVLDGFRVRTAPDRWRPGRFVHPHDACFDAEGNIFVAEWVSTGRISKLRRLS
ncbi:twin-arginine translocation signal domain-containing protein [Tautonia sp. JC769]|uniref:twin-arginine translocation signal domain-containing protein n=1 Tax=Tautonia sp. JC769 TaxID=3232135 RepID=UPI00345A4A30